MNIKSAECATCSNMYNHTMISCVNTVVEIPCWGWLRYTCLYGLYHTAHIQAVVSKPNPCSKNRLDASKNHMGVAHSHNYLMDMEHTSFMIENIHSSVSGMRHYGNTWINFSVWMIVSSFKSISFMVQPRAPLTMREVKGTIKTSDIALLLMEFICHPWYAHWLEVNLMGIGKMWNTAIELKWKHF